MRPTAARRGLLAVFGITLGLIPVSSGAPTTGAQADDPSVPDEETRNERAGNYIVTMKAPPALTYTGGREGIPATKPAANDKLATDSTAVVQYREYLTDQHVDALSGAGASADAKFHDYTVSLNGFAARLTPSQAARLSRQPGVVSVVPDNLRQVDTTTTPDFLGLTDDTGAWSRGHVGEDVVIGVVDTGIWPENRAFADATRRGMVFYDEPELWYGDCESGDHFNARNDCNNKLIGARYFGDGWGGRAGIEAEFPYEYYSPRDADGHGSHTASTSGGNRNVAVRIDGDGYGRMSGMAPRARIAAYKVCWGRGGEGGCFDSDSVAAIDQAVADGVDAINFSISGTSTDFFDAVEQAFLNASNSGVFVAASSGNDGPSESTTNHPSPWITTVAASTHDRASTTTLKLGNGDTYDGAGANPDGTSELPMVYAGDIPAAGADPEDAALCFPDTLDPAGADGMMVVCDRGVNARTEKSQVVRDAGGEAMVLVNPSPNSLNADFHFVPTIHVDADVRDELLAYVQGASPAGEISPAETVEDETAPLTAPFSGRGPSLSGGDILKPDITAPGVDVIAAVSPDGYFGRNFDLISGTSMSSPHIAGLSAVVKSAHPDWAPSKIKSAMMTTAYDVDDAGPFDVGSGHIGINKALEPGLTYHATSDNYQAFLCGLPEVTPTPICRSSIDSSDLNQPNIAIGELAGRQRVTRRVTNVGKAGTYRAEVEAPPGVSVTVTPSVLTLDRREKAAFRVVFTVQDGATFDEYTFGKLTWVKKRQRVESEIAVKPVALAAPDQVNGEGVEGAGDFDVQFGYTGTYEAGAHGMEAPTRQEDTVTDDPGNDINGALDCLDAPGGTEETCGIDVQEVDVPAGTALTRISTFNDYTDGDDDLDLYVFLGTTFVGGSGAGGSNEQVDLIEPDAGTYTVYVHGWETEGPDADYTLFDWSIAADPSADDDSLVIDSAPTAATVGGGGTVEYSWSGLLADDKYLGAISHTGPDGLIKATVVAVDTD